LEDATFAYDDIGNRTALTFGNGVSSFGDTTSFGDTILNSPGL